MDFRDWLDWLARLARRWGEDSRLIRHGLMAWTVGTFGTIGNDARPWGLIGDGLDAGD